MKKVLSLMSAAVMLTPMTANRVYAEDAGYKDPAQKYGLGSKYYTEEEKYVGPAEQELFDRIENGLIDIDIDRNGNRDKFDLTEQGRKNADVNGDGDVTTADALEIQKMDSRSALA